MAGVGSQQSRRGVFPGSFNPLTVAHLEIARLARDAYGLDTVVLAVSRVALDKPQPPGPSLAERLELIRIDLSPYPWLDVAVTEHQLIVEIARGFDVVIMGADKWHQVNDARYYEDGRARDAAIADLPTVAVAERDGSELNEEDDMVILRTPHELHQVSSSHARAGDRSVMAPHARENWTDT